MYLNDVPYGGAAIGVQAASQLYFNKDVKDLDLAQSAFLSGLPQSPSVLFALYRRQILHSKNQVVLDAMVRDGYIHKNRRQRSKRITNTQFAQNSLGIKAPHFVFYVKQQLIISSREQVVGKRWTKS